MLPDPRWHAASTPDGEWLDPQPALTEEEYVAEVLHSAPSLRTFTQPEEALLLGALGLCGEAGEVADLVKKYRYHAHQLDRAHLFDELGDVLWSLTWRCHTLDSGLGAVMLANVTRLRARYPQGFDPARSQMR
jgi:NTP pyrophosphatase (non-canonical NTP hydrolase)